MENAEKERILRNVLADIADHARELLEAFFRHGSDLEYVRDMLSPDGNNACVKLSRLQIALLRFGPGEIPPMWLTEWHTNSMRLAEEIRRLHPEIESLHHTWNAQKSLYDLLTERYIEYERADDYRDEIKAKIKVLRDKYRENSNGFNALLV